MRTRKIPALLFPAFFLVPILVAAQARVEGIGPVKGLPAAIAAAVGASGARLVRPDGSVLCEIWLANSLGKAAAGEGAAYPDLAPGMFLGVISFPNGGKDFRGQPVKGTFTMRHALLPEDGNHMGVAPTRDFVLLARAGDDPDPNKQYNFEQLVRLSTQASGTNHPAVFVMLSPANTPASRASDKGRSSTTYQNPDGYQVFAGMAKTADGRPVPVALVVRGQGGQ